METAEDRLEGNRKLNKDAKKRFKKDKKKRKKAGKFWKNGVFFIINY